MSKPKLRFLRDVLIFTFIAFGGPQAHIAMMLKEFVAKKKYITEEELIEYNALCQMLPGPSSTQTLIAIAYKFGGLSLAILSFFIWIIPSALIMALFAISFTYFDLGKTASDVLHVINPVAVGFVAYSAYVLSYKVLDTKFSYFLALISVVATVMFRNAYVFPVMIVLGTLSSSLFNDPKEQVRTPKLPVNWKKIIPFVAILLLFALLGALINRTSFFSLPVRLFENFYRNGIMIFGGGQVLVPLLFTEFVEMKHYLSTQEFLSGYAIQQILPGPVFAFTSFIGAMSVKNGGLVGQLLGSTAAVLGINIPGVLFILTIFPVWENLKKRRLIRSGLDGINAVSVGFAIAAFYIMAESMWTNWVSVLIMAVTFLLLNLTKIPPAVIIIAGLLAGFIF